MSKREDKNTRYYIDLDLLSREVVTWGFDQKDKLVHEQVLEEPFHRVFVTKGQYNKLDQKSVTSWLDLRNKAAHGHYDQYSKEQVALMLQSVNEFMSRNPG